MIRHYVCKKCRFRFASRQAPICFNCGGEDCEEQTRVQQEAALNENLAAFTYPYDGGVK